MKTIEEITSNNRFQVERIGKDGGIGYVIHPTFKKHITIVFSFGLGWDHVSASLSNRCPTWEEMCIVKDVFFNEDECVVQYHPSKADYVNRHPYCLHLWKPQDQEIPMPPKFMV